jgi:hypothetical protein
MANVIYAPTPYKLNNNLSVFLAGSIEMGNAENWQDTVIDALKEYNYIDILNPRRTDWDSSWDQSIDNPQFKEQVNWELDRLEDADYIFMYFQPKTISPISLLELGMFAAHKTMIVVCPEGYFRKGNVDIVCDRARIDYVCTDLESGISLLKNVMGVNENE